MCIRLHSLKILNGVTIAETVTAALEVYFAQMQDQRDPMALASAAAAGVDLPQ